jgi:hypothetical protein
MVLRHWVAIIVAVALAAPAHSATVWFGAVDRYAQPSNPAGASFMKLFEQDADWQDAAAEIQIFKVSTQFLHSASDAEVSAVIHGLQARNIALAMEGLMLPATPRCGRGVESYSGPQVIQGIADRVRRLGGIIRYVAMDEPIWFGNHYKGSRACGDSIEALANEMAHNVRILSSVFPGIRFGDIEPVNNQSKGHVLELLEFAKAFKIATGVPLTFVDADIIWQQDWRPQLKEWRANLHAAGITFGVICDGDAHDQSDIEWTAHAVGRYRAVMDDPQMRPDSVIFQSWMRRPAHLAPDRQPGTLTNAVVSAINGSK